MNKRNTTTLIKDLELQIDRLIGYIPSSNHWKKEYHIRETLLEEVLANENTPPEIREKIYRIQQTLFDMRNGNTHKAGYLDYIEQPTHDFVINDPLILNSGNDYALNDELMDRRRMIAYTNIHNDCDCYPTP